MKERPILFSAEMVRAILDGRKTQTRRKMKPRPASGAPDGVYCDPYNGNFEHFTFWTKDNKMCNGLTGNVKIKGKFTCHWKCPYGVPGDRLWVRETWQAVHFEKDFETGIVDDWYHSKKIPKLSNDGYWTACYESESKFPSDREERGFPWRPSIHMPRWASRITLEIVNVKVERLQDISEEDAKAEGVDDSMPRLWTPGNECEIKPAKARFASLWCLINGADSWEKNPWVWVIEFRRVA